MKKTNLTGEDITIIIMGLSFFAIGLFIFGLYEPIKVGNVLVGYGGGILVTGFLYKHLIMKKKC